VNANPELISRILANGLTRRLLRSLTRQRADGSCVLSDIFDRYGQPDLGWNELIHYGVPFALIDWVAKLAGSSREFVRDKVFVHKARARALTATARSVGRYGLTLPQRFTSPLMVVWNFTQACNLKCVHCYQDARRRLPDELDLGQQLQVLEALRQNDVAMLAFSGGEPMMSPTFWPVVERAAEMGFHVSVATNGTLVTEESACRLRDAGVKYIEVSIDSVEEDKHDRFRGRRGYWRRSVEGLKAAAGTEGVRAALAATITQLNIDELEELISFAGELGADCFYAFNFIPTGRAKDICHLDLSPRQREEMLRILRDHMQKDDISIITSAAQLARYCISEADETSVVNTGHYGHGRGSRAKLLSQYVGGCGAGRVYCAIQPNGVVTPCVFMPLAIGNILEGDFAELWETHPVLELLRDRSRRQGHCRVCEYKNYCGGCRARPYGYYGDLTMPDPGCIYNQDAWDALTQASGAVVEAAG